MAGESQQTAQAHPPEWSPEQRIAYDLGRDVGYVEGRASRQADVDELNDLADRYYRAAYGDERRLQVGGISRAELEARRQQQPTPPEITREAALASWGLDPEPPPVETASAVDEPTPSTTPRTNRTSRRRAMTTRTITGRVAADPEAVQAGRVQIVKFRVLENTGEYRNGAWVEHPTPTTHHVEAKFELGANALASLHTGDSVLVVGYEVTRTWEKEGKPRYGRVIEADAIGPNLAHSTAVITPQRRPRATPTGE
jgi:single-stranded DNA-binding protein